MQRATSLYVTVALVASLVVSIECENSIPGTKTAAGVIAASTDGVSRYLARDGPIQPAITAIAGLPMRGGEVINNGISSVSDTMNRGAQSMARRAGNDGTIRMPGMQTLRDNMPGPLASIGNSISSGIRYKNSAIMNQAKRGIEAGNRLSEMMSRSVKSINPMQRRRQDRNKQQDQSSDLNDDQNQQQQQQQNQRQQNNRQDRHQRTPIDRQNQDQEQSDEQPGNMEDFQEKGQGFRPDLVLDNIDGEDGLLVKAPGARGSNQQEQHPFDDQQQQRARGRGRGRGRQRRKGERQGQQQQFDQDMDNQDIGPTRRRGGRRGNSNQQQGDDQH